MHSSVARLGVPIYHSKAINIVDPRQVGFAEETPESVPPGTAARWATQSWQPQNVLRSESAVRLQRFGGSCRKFSISAWCDEKAPKA
eukprot:894854-Rhodomonas_salina.3